MELKSMILPKMKQQEETIKSPSNKGPRYPYGLNIRLENETIDKLGIDSMPSVGEELMVLAKAKVESVSVNEQSSGEKYRTISLQITDMAVEATKKKVDIEKQLYGEK